MASNGNTENQNGASTPSSADVLLGPDGQENVSDSLLESSEISEDADLESMRRRIHEMEEEAEKLKEMQLEVEKQLPGSTGTCTSSNSSKDH